MPLDSVGLEACHRYLGPARLLPRVSKAPFGITSNPTPASLAVNATAHGSCDDALNTVIRPLGEPEVPPELCQTGKPSQERAQRRAEFRQIDPD